MKPEEVRKPRLPANPETRADPSACLNQHLSGLDECLPTRNANPFPPKRFRRQTTPSSKCAAQVRTGGPRGHSGHLWGLLLRRRLDPHDAFYGTAAAFSSAGHTDSSSPAGNLLQRNFLPVRRSCPTRRIACIHIFTNLALNSGWWSVQHMALAVVRLRAGLQVGRLQAIVVLG